MNRDLQRWDSKGWDGCKCLDEMTKNIEHGDVDNSFESSEELVSNHSTKDGREIT